MKTLVILGLLLALTSPADAVVIHNEAIHGDLSTNPAAPTPLAFGLGGNTIIGTVNNSGAPTGDRDYITFTIGAGQTLTALNLLAFSPTNLAFAAFNAGATSFVPNVANEANFLSGIHISGLDVGSNLLIAFATNSVTSNSLPAPLLGPGQYSFVIQQTSVLTTSYSLEFFVEAPVPARGATWGAIKALYQ